MEFKHLKSFSHQIQVRMAMAVVMIGFGYLCASAGPVTAAITSQPTQSDHRVTGTVLDENGEPVVGASILVKGLKGVGAVSDLDGKFSLMVPRGSVLEVSYVGYLKQDVKASGDRVVIKIIPDKNDLEEVVVVGYGTQKKGNLSTAISTIKEDEINTTIHYSLAQRLEGKVPGLQIRQQTGEPGNFSSSINIRGFGQPLFILDGTTRLSAKEFQMINPEDIESISVLKDGSAAIYGMNAANGVILVTTKRGKSGKAQFTYDGSMSFSTPTDIPKMADAYQYVTMVNDAQVNVGGNPVYSQEEVANWKAGGPGYESTDWYDLVMKKHSMQQMHTISARGGTDVVNYYTSFGYTRNDGLLRSNATWYEKYSILANLSAKMTKYLRLNVNMNGFYAQNHNSSNSFFDIIRGTVGEEPIHRPYANDNPDYLAYVYDGQVLNPLALSNPDVVGYQKNLSKSFKARGELVYDVPWVKGLQLKGVAYYEHGNSTAKSLAKEYRLYSYDPETDTYPYTIMRAPTRLDESSSDGNGLTLQAQIDYRNTFAEKHNVGATLVYEQRNYWNTGLGAMRYFTNYLLDQLNFGDVKDQNNSDGESKSGFKSYVGRFSYDYMGKYIFEYAFRYDGSYRYHPDHRWGFFPVYSAAWRVSEEPFFKKALPFVSNFKIRASYGIVGEDAGAAFQYVGGFSLNNGGFEFADGNWTSGAGAPSLTNEALSWYKSRIKNLGFDLAFFDNRLNMSLDIYRRNRTGLLATRLATLPNTFGASLPQENLNKDCVQGFDFVISYATNIGRDWSINASANFNFARRQVKYVERSPFTNSWDRWHNGQVDRWDDIVWMYDYIGQFQNYDEIANSPIQDGTLGNSREMPGDFKYRDVNNDGVIDGDDQIPIAHNGTPKMFYGLTLGARWKGFDFSMLWQGAAKYTVRFTHYYATMLWNNANLPEYFYDRWHLSDQYDSNSEWVKGEWPAIRNQADMGAMYSDSEKWRRDASFVRLKSLSIGYSIPKKLLYPLGIQSMRLSLSGYNLLTICDSFVKPFDPEKIEGTLNTGWVYPLEKSFNVGLSVTF